MTTKLCGNCSGNHKYEDCPTIDLQFPPTKKEYAKLKEDAEQLERVDSLFAELNIPIPYDLWLAESIQIRERLKKELENTKKFPNSIYYPILQKVLGDNNG